MRVWVIGMAALALAGCEKPEPQNSAEAAAAAENAALANTEGPIVSNYQEAVIALPAGQRDLVFVRAIRDARLPCQSVTASERIEDQNRLPTWKATCGNGTAHLISITKDGTANILSRAD